MVLGITRWMVLGFLVVFALMTMILDFFFPTLGVQNVVIQISAWIVGVLLLLLYIVKIVMLDFRLDLFMGGVLASILSLGLILEKSIVDVILFLPQVIVQTFIVVPIDFIANNMKGLVIDNVWWGFDWIPIENTVWAHVPGLRDLIATDHKLLEFTVSYKIEGNCVVCASNKWDLNVWVMLEQILRGFTLEGLTKDLFGIDRSNAGVQFLLWILKNLWGIST